MLAHRRWPASIQHLAGLCPVTTMHLNTLYTDPIPANLGNSLNAVSILGQRRRRWADIETALGEYSVFAGMAFLNVAPPSLVLANIHSTLGNASCIVFVNIILVIETMTD